MNEVEDFKIWLLSSLSEEKVSELVQEVKPGEEWDFEIKINGYTLDFENTAKYVMSHFDSLLEAAAKEYIEKHISYKLANTSAALGQKLYELEQAAEEIEKWIWQNIKMIQYEKEKDNHAVD